MNIKLLIFTFLVLGITSLAKEVDLLNLDSLTLIIKTEPQPDSLDVYVSIISEGFNQYTRKKDPQFLPYMQAVLKLAKSEQNVEAEAWTSYYLGKHYITVGDDYSKALPNLLNGMALFQRVGNDFGTSQCIMQMGLISYMTDYFEDAISHFEHSLAYYNNPTSRYLMGISLSELGHYSEAKIQFRRAIKSFKAAKRYENLDECYMYMGSMYVQENKLDSANFYLQTALNNSLNKDSVRLSRPYSLLAEYYLKKQDLDSAEFCALRSIELAHYSTDKLSPQLSSEVLSVVYERLGEFEKAHRYLKQTYALKYQSFQGDTKQKIAEIQTIFEFKRQIAEEEQRHIAEIREKNQFRNAILVSGLFLLLTALALYSRLVFVRKSKAALQLEQNRSEKLLRNILPEEIAIELKEKGEAKARNFELASIMFTDFKDFTEQSARLSATELVAEIDHCFQKFDEIIDKYNIEKIKTIGDAYMASGGIPVATSDSVQSTVLAALEMQRFIKQRNEDNKRIGKAAFEMRVGIHSGPVVAGIVGVKKFQYDIWGDTVNTASRIETAGLVNKVNISRATYDIIKNDSQFVFESRGLVSVKGKGLMEMWFVNLAKTG